MTMLKVGVTGGIGSGKTVVCNLLRVMGYPVFNSDAEAKRLCNEYEPLKQALKEAFGEVLYHDGVLNNALFASIIFNDSSKLMLANSIIHPAVTSYFLNWAKTLDTSIVFIESAILFECNLQNHIDKAITVFAPEKLRIERVANRESVNQDVVLERIKNQLPESERQQKADYIIFNDDEHLIIPQVEAILSFLQ